ncbi:hypothetical protein LX64_01847 [Chitinophaga skermanii]|uniref:Uncharacterized protein n=1 Tax=Chitinophaga skermanii TaxID=331697 RepID=A0A327QQW2_9BACT|nr:hypothetical protein [Chitinophaga skermanii]RAJ06720.1 hypothetical protein LX64_01847 [Chitinophaga skermanii]
MKESYNKENFSRGQSILIFSIALAIGGILIVIIFFLFGKFAVFYGTSVRNSFKAENNFTIGNVVDVGSYKGSYAIFEYVVENVKYEGRYNTPASDVEIGEHYIIYYRKKDPNDIYVDFSEKVFLPNDSTLINLAKVIYVDDAKVRYQYKINGMRYFRFQRIESKGRYKLDSTYRIEYLIANPKNSKIVE